MKHKILTIVILIAVAGMTLITLVSPKGSMAAVEFSVKKGAALDRVPKFQQRLEADGFTLYEGKFAFMDAVKECCEQHLKDTLGNNPWPSTYVIAQDLTPEGYPETIRPWVWRLREDEAIVLIGQTSPKAAYFSYGTFIAFLPEVEHKVGIPVGDGYNNLTIHTNGRDPFNRPIVYIITGHRETERRIRKAAQAAGYPASIINVETVSPVIAPLGLRSEGSSLFLLHRVTIAEDPGALLDYIENPPYRVFRVTPNPAGEEPPQLDPLLDPDPQPVPVLRVRGTGHTEMELYPALKRLREAILEAYPNTSHKVLDTQVFWEDGKLAEKPYVGLQREIDVLGATRDTNYFATYPYFMLRESEGEDEFVIVYGVNHQTTGKATYASFSAYADPDRLFGLATTYSPDFDGTGRPGDSARKYLCPDDVNECDPDVQYLYAWKVARHCDGEAFCMEVPQPEFEDIGGGTYKCDPEMILEDQEAWLAFRTYLEPSTKTGPDDNELLYDQAIYFGPYFEES